MEEVHEWMAEATMNPVELGSPVTDHVIEQPDKLRIKGFITDSPLIPGLSLFSGIIDGAKSTVYTQPVFDVLNEIIKARELVTVYTKYKIYTDMIITNISIPRGPQVQGSIEFTVDFVKIRIVKTQTTSVPDGISALKDNKKTPALGRKTEPQKDIGKKQPQTIESLGKTSENNSTLRRIFGQ